MAAHRAIVEWRRGDQPFVDKRYSRAHLWTFDGGEVVRGSSSPSGVPVPLSDPTAVDPEEAMVASVSSCHMLWFLALAAHADLVVDSYRDAASGELDRNEAGRKYLARITLRPVTAFSGRQPDQAELDALHHEAHERCEMGNSVRAVITTEATIG